MNRFRIVIWGMVLVACLFVFACRSAPDVVRVKIGDHRPPVEQTSVERDLEAIHSQLTDSDFAALSTDPARFAVIAYRLT